MIVVLFIILYSQLTIFVWKENLFPRVGTIKIR